MKRTIPKRILPLVAASLFAVAGGLAYGQDQGTNDKYVTKDEYLKLKQELEALKAQLQQQSPPANKVTPPPADADALKARVDQLEKKQAQQQTDTDQSMDQMDKDLKNLYQKTKAAIPGTTKMLIAGYAGATFQAYGGGYGPSQPPEETAAPPRAGQSTFLANFNPIFLWKLSDRLLYVGEMELETDVNTRTVGVNLETSYMAYELNDYMDIDAGVFLDPADYFIERQHMGWVNKFPDKPLAVYDGLMPESLVGVQLRGGIPLGPFKGEYAFFTTMAPQLVAQSGNALGGGPMPEIGTIDGDNYGHNYHIATGGRVGFFPIPELEVGYGIQAFNADPVNAAGASLGSGVSTLLQSVDVNYVVDSPKLKGKAELRGQWVWSHINSFAGYLDTAGAALPAFNNNRNGGYVELAYRPTKVDNKILQNLEAAVRYDMINELHTPVGLNERRLELGLDYWLGSSTVLKVAYAIDRQHGWTGSPFGANAQNGNAFLAQFIIGF